MLVSYFADKGVVTVDDNHGADEVVVKLRWSHFVPLQM